MARLPRRLVATRCKLRVGQSKVAVIGRDAPDCFQLSGCGRRQANVANAFLDPVVCHLFVRNVVGRRPGHMTCGAVLIFGMMLLGKCAGVVTLQAFLPIEGDLLVGRGRPVRIVTGGTRQAIARLPLAFAAQERFPLTGGAPARSVLAAVHEVQREIEQVLAGQEILQLPAIANDGSLSFEVAVEAN